jgi:hypothetical protein
MKKQLETDQVIENLIAAMLGDDATMRQKHLFRESLRGLVRLAKSEQVMDIKANVKKLTGALDAQNARRRAKAVLLAQRLPGILASAQQQFEFN